MSHCFGTEAALRTSRTSDRTPQRRTSQWTIMTGHTRQTAMTGGSVGTMRTNMTMRCEFCFTKRSFFCWEKFRISADGFLFFVFKVAKCSFLGGIPSPFSMPNFHSFVFPPQTIFVGWWKFMLANDPKPARSQFTSLAEAGTNFELLVVFSKKNPWTECWVDPAPGNS